ncbi:voltage-gated hydrogen channel 1-like isoform X2 [Liolophura sinensis]|uniref:voltage-gated hydrogen channel 1-like isoform X2 n=1 Tax=Liolophura sinensis TaxID=3198878 RepID=UPI0031593C72
MSRPPGARSSPSTGRGFMHELMNLLTNRRKIRRRWKRSLTNKESERYAYQIEEHLEDEATEEVPEEKANQCSSCREKGRNILHSKHVLRTIVALCIIDCIMVMVELILDNTAVRHDIVDKYGLVGMEGDKESVKNHTAPERHRRAASGGDGADHGSHSTYAVIAHYCHYVSVAILCLLTLETLIKIFCFGKKFFHSKLEVFDGFVVIASLIADLVLLDGVTNEPPLLSSAIVNILLPWRIIRVVNSLVIATRDHEHYKLLLVYKSKKQVEDQMDQVIQELQESRNHVERLILICRKNGVDTEEISLHQKTTEPTSKSPGVQSDDVKIRVDGPADGNKSQADHTYDTISSVTHL